MIASVQQLVRERPPGYGGVERVAHEMANEWHRKGVHVRTFCLRSNDSLWTIDSVKILYELECLPGLPFGQFICPLPTIQLLSLLNSKDTLHVHLPCPSILLIAIIARLRHPKRLIRLHWHAFLEPSDGLTGGLIQLYQWVALRWASVGVQSVVTTSPVLAKALEKEGVKMSKIIVLSCCLAEEQEKSAFRICKDQDSRKYSKQADKLRLLFIGRLDSYKRVDWLIDAFTHSRAIYLDVVGDGPYRQHFEKLALLSGKSESISFHGRVDEATKQFFINNSHLLILPSDRSNEAFGIVQIEAMACGVPALALDCPRSGVAWVGNLKGVLNLPHIHQQELVKVINYLVDNPEILDLASREAKSRYLDFFSRTIWESTFAHNLL